MNIFVKAALVGVAIAAIRHLSKNQNIQQLASDWLKPVLGGSAGTQMSGSQNAQ